MEPRGRERHRWANRQVGWSFWEKRHRRQSREGSDERVGRRTNFNGADGISDIEHVSSEGMERLGKAT